MDVMQIVTERILASLEKGVIPWKRPWCCVDGAYNRFTGKTYSLLNQMLLGDGGEYATYKQWKNAGFTVRRNADARMVVFWKWPDDTDTDMVSDETDGQDNQPDNPDLHTDAERKKKAPILRYYKVFSIRDIVENPSPVKTVSTESSSVTPIDKAEKLLHDYLDREGIRLECGPSNEAFYSPIRDIIHMPLLGQFSDSEHFYCTALHEAVHSTGAEKRLSRKGVKQIAFGSATYSKEELIAEIGSSCLMHHLGISTEETEENSSAYIQGWLRTLRDDSPRNLIVFAAAAAEKAVRFILDEK